MTPALVIAASKEKRYWSRTMRSEKFAGAVLIPPS